VPQVPLLLGHAPLELASISGGKTHVIVVPRVGGGVRLQGRRRGIALEEEQGDMGGGGGEASWWASCKEVVGKTITSEKL
jgi:hypothetical protein